MMHHQREEEKNGKTDDWRKTKCDKLSREIKHAHSTTVNGMRYAI